MEEIRKAASIDLNDFFVYTVGESVLDLENAPYGGFRFPIECRMAGRRFAHFNIDIAAGDVWLSPHESLAGHGWLDFAGISAPRIPAISPEQQLAEKFHSYTLPRKTPNSRTKDLVDIVLIIDRCAIDPALLRNAIRQTFRRRRTHEIPIELGDPPETWRVRYKTLAVECGIPGDFDSAVRKAWEYYRTLMDKVKEEV